MYCLSARNLDSNITGFIKTWKVKRNERSGVEEDFPKQKQFVYCQCDKSE